MPSDWERVAGDPELLADVRRRFTGTGDPLDHLRWIEHPGTDFGSGTEDPAPLPASTVRSCLRHIGTSSTTGTALDAAHARAGDVCIVAVVQALRQVEACSIDGAFARAGLSMAFQAAVDPIDDSGLSRDQEVVPTWAPDGVVRF